MPAAHLIVRHIGVMERDVSAAVARGERDRHDRFQSPCRFRNPCVFDPATAIEPDETAVVRPRSTLVPDHVVKKPVDHRIDDDAFDAEPEPAGTLRVEPGVEHFVGRAGNRAGNREIVCLHLVSPFYATNASRCKERFVAAAKRMRLFNPSP